MQPHIETLKYIFDYAKVGIAICNAQDNTLEMVNSAFAAIHGYVPQELIGASLDKVFSSECIQHLEGYEQSLTSIDDIDLETTHIRKDGSFVHVSIHITLIKDESGVIKQFIANIQDISDRKYTEYVLNETYKRYTQIFNNSVDVIYMVEVTPDRKFIYIDVNSAYTEVTGIARDTVIGLCVDEIEDEIFRTILIDKFTCCLTTAGKTDYIANYPFRSGTKTYHSVLTPLFDKSGRIHQIVGIARDITEQKQMEFDLASREQEFQSLAENTPDNIVRLDCEGRYLYINPVHEQILGKSLAEVTGTFIPDSHEAVKVAIEQVVRTGEKIIICQTLPSQEGSVEYHEVNLVPERDVSGKIISVLGIGRDVTERKQQEAQLHKTKAKLAAVISSIPDLIWVKDVEGVYMMSNPAFEQFFGAECDEILGKTDYDFLSSEQADFFRQKDREAMEAGEMRINEEEIIFAHNGQHALLETRKVPVYDNGKLIGILGIGRDITQQKETEKTLMAREREFRNLSENSPNIIIRYDHDCRQIYVNQAYAYQTGTTVEQAINSKPADEWDTHLCLLTINAQEYEKRIKQVIVSGEADYFTIAWYRLSDGAYVVHEFYLAVEHDLDGNSIGVLAIGHDITEHKKNEDILAHKESRLKEAQKIAKMGSWELEFSSQQLTWSDEIYSIFEIPQISQHPEYSDFINAIHPQDRELVNVQYSESLKNKTPYEVIHRLLLSNGRIKYVHEKGLTYYDGNGDPLRSIGTAQDVTEQKSIEKKIEFLAHHDALTGLPNRILAKDRTDQSIAHAKRNNTQIALLFIDLDEFKVINDSLGHSAGDTTLQIIASRLKECIRECDIISRQGGDEFLIILSDITVPNDIITITEKLLQEFEKQFLINDQPFSTSASIGIATYPANGNSFEVLLKNADTAMYKAKESGKNTYCFYSEQMNHDLIGQFKIQNDLKSALQNSELVLHYQPQIDLSHNTIIGAEALIRWQHPLLGMMPPMSFIPIAESSGLIVPIGEWVIQEACRQAAKWQKEGKEITVAVNISAVQFKRGNLENVVKEALESSGLNPHFLELELTESILINDVETILKTVQHLKGLGIQLSIDDFGTGYSSLAYLKRFAVDKLKIDQSFVRDILKDPEDAAIVRAIIQMAKSLNLKTIAEGVEDKEVLSLIESYECDEVQGYHFAKPMRTTEFETYYHQYTTNVHKDAGQATQSH